METLPDWLNDYIGVCIQEIKRPYLYNGLLRYKISNILRKKPKSVFNYFKLLAIPKELICDILKRKKISFTTIRELINNDEYVYDNSDKFIHYINLLKNGNNTGGIVEKTNYCTWYTCSKCKCNKTTLIEKQTRSCDELSTVIAKCVKCGYTWRP